ncbi:hypothetical protein [Corynebacterium lipophiloflavum]|uniref:Uncharacterized protein n=1 Tax=Corynebacterium lipophiloflavum (strain ATCC 700352 / DSM 44291 / CCUG 37336 / JCM 10383 / DMMZ 1944) TaxID=525263 RepID=C0XUC0_CORLD|nr:hypothetical protein [Corynebacterium lipophiloflavum]EEI16186.1 hypothetical protein HMPREF0298_2040 [Corynebacterium lipophiloflavum DSM 44291]
MANTTESVADIRSESFPDYQQRIEDAYIEGYDPVSLGAPHSSLNTHALWIAMGLILAALFGVGLAVWGGAAMVWGMGSESNIGSRLLILGLIEFAATMISAVVLMFVARRGYKDYRTRTGRVN